MKDKVSSMKKPRGVPTLAHLVVVVTCVFLAATPARGQATTGVQPTSPETILVQSYLANPRPELLGDALEAAERASADRQARAEVRLLLQRAFEARWLRPDGSSSSLTLQDIAKITVASKCEPFGRARAELTTLLVRHPLPKDWSDRIFLEWLRQELPAQTGATRTAELLLRGPAPSDPTDRLKRHAFLMEIVPGTDVTRVRAALHHELQTASPADMRQQHEQLEKLAAVEALSRWSEAGDTTAALRLLGDRLFGLPPESWGEARETLSPLVRASSHAPAEFLKRCAGVLRSKGGPAVKSSSETLEALLVMVPAPEGYTLLEPEHSVEWFVALHETSLLQKLHARDALLLARSFELLKQFDAQGHFARLFLYLKSHYYRQSGYAGRAFDELLRPRARAGETALVLGAALEGEFLPEHRARLAQDNLHDGRAAGGTGLAPAWPGASGCRLKVAVDIFVNLAEPGKDTAAVLNERLNHPLLDDIVGESLILLRAGGEPLDKTLPLLRPLAARIKEYRSAGADTFHSEPLLRLEREVAADVEHMLKDLPGGPSGRAADRAETRAVVRRFVANVALALRLRGLLGEALGNTPDWVGLARRGLRDRVFGLGSDLPPQPDPAPDVISWDDTTTRFRAELLTELDAPLRECLTLDESGQDGDSFWQEIYLPLVRVHGFLKVLRQPAAKEPWPHLAWAQAGTKEQQRRRFEDVFRALRTGRWLDADEAVLQLAKEHQTRVLGENAWVLEPDQLFAGHWGVNCNFLVWKRLLEESPPPAGKAWKLPEIARQAIDQLCRGSLPTGPTFPIAGNRPAVDASADPWDFVPWTLNVVTAAEWQRSPFLDERGARLPEPQFAVTLSPKLPFAFELGPREVTREKVDGKLRSELCAMLLKRIADRSSERPATTPDRLILAADAVMMLPNHDDNTAVPGGQTPGEALRHFLTQRQEIYKRLDDALEPTTISSSRAGLLKAMMRLDVSRRDLGTLDPPFDEVQKKAETWADRDARLRDELVDIRAERTELLELIQGQRADSLASARRYVDGKINAILPAGVHEEDENLIDRDYQERLAALDDARVLHVLRIRSQLRTILKKAVHAAGADAGTGEGVKDLDRVVRMLRLIDCTIFYGRRDFRPGNYLTPSSAGNHDGKSRRWWPALVVLAWFDAELQQEALALCQRLDRDAGEETRQLIARTRLRIYDLNESIFCTIDEIARRSDAETIFAEFSPHKIEWDAIHFRLLAKTKVTEDASAESLSRDCFRGVLNNLEIATAGRAPSDEDLQNRLFGSLSHCWPEKLRRATTRLNIDGVVRIADQWTDRPSIPPALKAGAAAFLAEGHTNLLANAASVKGVLDALAEILDRGRKPQATDRYRAFFDAYLTHVTDGKPALSAEFETALGAPFFRGQVPRQRQDVAGMLNFWRKTLARKAAVPPAARAESACRDDLGRVLSHLVQGVGCPENAVHLFGPADALIAETGPRAEPPAEFFELVTWWFRLARPDDPPNVRRLFVTDPERPTGGSTHGTTRARARP
jgi:hypothetical protein